MSKVTVYRFTLFMTSPSLAQSDRFCVATECSLSGAGSIDRRNTFASNLTRWIGRHMDGHARTWFMRKQKAELSERWK
jgi:hypothetical protein